ncbi:cytochrome c oxidase subunit II [Balneolaceae bacterium YR4-1]|uniref:Cytochrome c oxidase subunit 2 n=1 Tax=Halalkalibaculum roseum TaxID=2709311 RepID=A0A6M1SXY5_9BACT|nr:cytochrome c oxidase subunit II [Halalkalibaculum roseum]NGP77138.1 cytochrome c oxidase subunit II [Halalkalibaculum roseum]
MEALRDFILPPAKSTVASEVDALFWFVHLSSLVLTIGILVALAYFLYKYRRKSENDVTPVITHNNKLEVTWSVIPLIITLVVFGWGFQTYVTMTTPPDDAYEINVTAQKWLWNFTYENGARSTGELHVPADRPVKLIMSSNDVIHSFFVPDYRIKQDVVPGRYTETWFRVPEAGESIIFCTEYCGTGHSDMYGKVIVHEQGEFENWLASNQGGGSKPDDLAPAEWGEQLAQEQACATCHSADGSQMTGPTWQGLFGSNRQFTDGNSAEADENYLRTSILNPNDEIVEGYQPVMPSYQGQLNDEQINAIIEYIKTLN